MGKKGETYWTVFYLLLDNLMKIILQKYYVTFVTLDNKEYIFFMYYLFKKGNNLLFGRTIPPSKFIVRGTAELYTTIRYRKVLKYRKPPNISPGLKTPTQATSCSI